MRDEFYNLKFNSYDEFEKDYHKFKEENYLVTHIRTSRRINKHDPVAKTFVYETIVFKCKHGLESKTRQIDGKRANQQSFFTNCKYSASLFVLLHHDLLIFHLT